MDMVSQDRSLLINRLLLIKSLKKSMIFMKILDSPNIRQKAKGVQIKISNRLTATYSRNLRKVRPIEILKITRKLNGLTNRQMKKVYLMRSTHHTLSSRTKSYK